MLGKLIKYEIRASGKMLFILYPAIIVLAIINKLLFYFGEDSPSNIIAIPTILSTMLYVCLIGAVFLITLIIMIIRFHKNLLGEEGYLMFTLPVKTHNLILSKLIVTAIWFIVAWVVSIGSVLILIPDYSFMSDFPQIWDSMTRGFQDIFDVSLGGYLALFIPLCFVCLTTFILTIYTAISIGHLANKNRILASFGAYIVISIVVQSITMIYLSIAGQDLLSVMLSPNTSSFPVMNTMLFDIILATCLSVIYFFITRYILSKKLNIE